MTNKISCSLPWAIRTAGILIRILDIFGRGVFVLEFPLLHDIWNVLILPVFNTIITTHRSSQIFLLFTPKKPLIQSKYYLITVMSSFLSCSLIFRHIFFLIICPSGGVLNCTFTSQHCTTYLENNVTWVSEHQFTANTCVSTFGLTIILSMFLHLFKSLHTFHVTFLHLARHLIIVLSLQTSTSLGVLIKTDAAEGRGFLWICTARSKQCHHTL